MQGAGGRIEVDGCISSKETFIELLVRLPPPLCLGVFWAMLASTRDCKCSLRVMAENNMLATINILFFSRFPNVTSGLGGADWDVE